MCNPFQGIRNAVSKIVHRVDAPFVARLVMFSKLDTIQNRIAHNNERRSHVDLGAQARCALGKLAVTHFFEQSQILFNAAVTVRAIFTRRRQGATVFTDLLRSQLINISQALSNQFYRVLVQLIEVVGGITHCATPLET